MKILDSLRFLLFSVLITPAILILFLIMVVSIYVSVIEAIFNLNLEPIRYIPLRFTKTLDGYIEGMNEGSPIFVPEEK